MLCSLYDIHQLESEKYPLVTVSHRNPRLHKMYHVVHISCTISPNTSLSRWWKEFIWALMFVMEPVIIVILPSIGKNTYYNNSAEGEVGIDVPIWLIVFRVVRVRCDKIIDDNESLHGAWFFEGLLIITKSNSQQVFHQTKNNLLPLYFDVIITSFFWHNFWSRISALFTSAVWFSFPALLISVSQWSNENYCK